MKKELFEKILEKVASQFSLEQTAIIEKKAGVTSTELANARGTLIYLLKNTGKFSYRDIGLYMGGRSGGNIHTDYQKIADYYASNTYHLKETIDSITENLQTVTPMAENTENIEKTTEPNEPTDNANENLGNDSEKFIVPGEDFEERIEDTPDPIDPSKSPFGEQTISRDIENVLKPDKKLLDELEELKDLEEKLSGEKIEVIPEIKIENQPNPDPSKSTIKMDEETAGFSATAILNGVEFVSVEVCVYSSKIDEKEVRELEKAKEVPVKSEAIAREANDNCKKELKQVASDSIKLLEEPLKKVLQKRNVSVSPEAALLFSFVIFAFTMFMATRRIKKDNDAFIDKLRALHLETQAKAAA